MNIKRTFYGHIHSSDHKSGIYARLPKSPKFFFRVWDVKKYSRHFCITPLTQNIYITCCLPPVQCRMWHYTGLKSENHSYFVSAKFQRYVASGIHGQYFIWFFLVSGWSGRKNMEVSVHGHKRWRTDVVTCGLWLENSTPHTTLFHLPSYLYYHRIKFALEVPTFYLLRSPASHSLCPVSLPPLPNRPFLILTSLSHRSASSARDCF